jgi:carboxypeptidase Taq
MAEVGNIRLRLEGQGGGTQALDAGCFPPPHPSPACGGGSKPSSWLELKRRLTEISDLSAAAALLHWDQATYMPRRGITARSRQGALLSRVAHERAIDPGLGRLLGELAPYAESSPGDADDACLIRVATRDFEKASRIPADYVARADAHRTASFEAWTRARPANDFAAMVPFLNKTLDLSREYAEFFAPYQHIADPLIDDADEGMTAASIRALFADLQRELVPMLRAICEQSPSLHRFPPQLCPHPNPPPLAGEGREAAGEGKGGGVFGRAQQLAFNRMLAERIGYHPERGRLDETHHPFCTKFSIDDVRITTRVYEHDIGQALFSTIHEAGHAFYEQGVDAALDGTPLGHGVSAGVHESQSRLWENQVARSRGFWQHFYPQLQRAFPDALAAVELDSFYRAINRVERSLIRTDADEVTYNLHIMLRFELELDLLEGRLRVVDLPQAWREGMRSRLGLVPTDDRDGCLQDVHWYSGMIGGAFQSYTIGNILAAQFYAAALRAHPQIPAEIASGNFGTLHGWLRHHIYRHGRKYPPNELIERATGSPMRMAPYLDYLRAKYGEIYELPPPPFPPPQAGEG